MKKLFLLMAVLFVVSVSAFAQSAKQYELRIYTANADKLGNLQGVVRAQGLPLFTKYGIENVFDGTVLEGARVDGADAPNMLVMVLAHPSRAAADKAWASVDGDAAWSAAVGPLLAKPVASTYMSATDFSPALEAPAAAGRVFELRRYNTGPDALPTTVAQFKGGLGAVLVKQGMTPILYWTADDHSSFIYLLAHKDREAAKASWASFMTDFRPFMADFNAKNPPAPLAPGAAPARRRPDDNRFLTPTEYSPRR